MTESPQIRTEVDDRVLKIVVDNVRKKNAFVPEMMVGLSEALTAFDRNDEQWVAVVERAARAARPKLRYTAGSVANRVRWLRRFAPARLVDGGIRKDLRLDALASSPPRAPILAMRRDRT